MRVLKRLQCLLLVVVFALLAACATVPKPLVGIVPGRQLETLQAGVSLSVHTPGGSTGGRGVLVYRSPDRFHLVILSPFGLTLMEIFVNGAQVTWLVPGKSLAYRGTFDDLPAREGMRAWGLMRWVVEPTPPPGPAEMREYARKDGSWERIYYDRQGIVQRKLTEDGDQVVYKDYEVIDGIPFPDQMELSDSAGDQVRLIFEDPELNQPVEESALTPDLSGFKVLPFSAFQGF